MKPMPIPGGSSATSSGQDLCCPAPLWPLGAGSILRAHRALSCAAIFLKGLPVYFRLRLSGSRDWRPAWAQWISQNFLGLIDCRVCISGDVPQHGLIVCNHLSYLDILAILSACPAVFVSKDDVRRWPFFGQLAMMAGTVFVNRKRRMAVSTPLNSVVSALKAGLPVVVFPEGTSSDGSSVFPFQSSLLEAAILAGVPITPAAISYGMQDGNVADEICYWRDMTFGSHFWNLLGNRSITASLGFGTPHEPSQGRKELARALRLAVIQLRACQAAGSVS